MPDAAAAAAGGGSGTAAAAGDPYKLVSVDLVVEGVVVCFPHDEAPMRVFVLTETWAKAVKQVWGLSVLLDHLVRAWLHL